MRYLALSVMTICAVLTHASAFAADHFQLLEGGSDVTTDIGAKGDSPGDLLTFNGPISTPDGKKKLGSDQGFCIRIEVGKSWECSFTLTLADGEISVKGPYTDAGDSTMIVTGGSGHYKNAKGTVIAHLQGSTPETTMFTFDLY